MTPDLSVAIAGVEFANPIMTASGCCGYGEELCNVFPLSKLGALVTIEMGKIRAEGLGEIQEAIDIARAQLASFIEEQRATK